MRRRKENMMNHELWFECKSDETCTLFSFVMLLMVTNQQKKDIKQWIIDIKIKTTSM